MSLKWREIGPSNLSHFRINQTVGAGVQITAMIHSVETGTDLVMSYPVNRDERLALAILLLEGLDDE